MEREPTVEEELPGGGTTKVVRVGDTVRRPVHPWSPAIRVLLRRLRAAGVAGVPAWRGVDGQERDIFDYLPGEVGNYPLPRQVRRDSAVISAARLLRGIHDASVPLVEQAGLPWQQPPMEQAEVVCHGDFAPYNCVFRDGEAVGVIDFDFARPGPRRWDLGYALYRFAPLTAPGNTDGFGDSAEQARRARLFLDSYGCTREERHVAMETVVPRLEALIAFMSAAARGGDRNFARHIEEGHADLYRADIAYITGQLPQWLTSIAGTA